MAVAGTVLMGTLVLACLSAVIFLALEYLYEPAYSGPPSLLAQVTVGSEPLHNLPASQYGHFIEHMGRGVNGGIWAEGESADMFLGGVRWELVEVMRSLKPLYIRYPGGCFADVYHWRDGIGPRAQRPERENQFWGGVEDNHFGTDEFMALCEAVGARPMLTVNFGTGTPEEAAAWVEYCNGAADTQWGAERAKNGHPEPYKVAHWFVGNETFGPHEPGNQSPETYAGNFKTFAAAMRAVDPSIQVIAVGDFYPSVLSFLGKKVNRKVLQGAGAELDLLSIHQYAPHWGPVNLIRHSILNRKSDPSRKIYYKTLTSLNDFGQFLHRCIEDVNQYAPADKTVPLVLDEWNLWFGRGETTQSNFNLRDALWTASVLQMLHRVAPQVPFANIAQMVNGLGIIWSDQNATFLTASGQVFKLYANHAGDELLPAEVEAPQLPDRSGLAALDVSATRTGDRVILFFVNRHYDAEIDVTCALPGFGTTPRLAAWEIHHENPVQYNTAESPNEVVIRERAEEISVAQDGSSSTLRLSLKPHSVVCVALEPGQPHAAVDTTVRGTKA